jgi:hypothetical protein
MLRTSESSERLSGSCLCGAVAFEIDGAPTPMELCHCSRCQKAYGSAFAATFYVRASAFRWTRGESLVTTYAAPIRQQPPAYRHVFCRTCGSALPIVNRDSGYAEIPAGVMDQDPGCRPVRHIFTRLKAPWSEITDGLPAHEGHAPATEHVVPRLTTPAQQK